MDKYIGRLLDNRYEILEVIGTGGMAVVYKARCHRLNRLVAIKILNDDYLEDEDFRSRFHAESQAVAMLSHPNIVSVYDVSTSQEADYIVMELIDGISLKQYMEKKGVLNWKETLHFAMQIAKALEHAHGRGIVHRDIKPHNVMVLKNGSVKVADFGIARVMSKGNTLTKEALGSVHYISPEQAKGGRVDNRSDIYSLGVVMYEMMSGRPPYDGESPVAVAIQHINGGAIMPSILNPNIPGGLEQIIMRAMAHSIEDRYPSAAAMLSDMDEFRKNPAILFDYNAQPMDDILKMPRPEPVEDLAARTTGERIAKREAQENQRAAAAHKNSASKQPKPPKVRTRRAEEDNNSRAATIVIISCSLVMVVAIVIFMIVLFSGGLSNGNKDLVEVPQLVGKEYAAVSDSDGFTVKLFEEVYDDTVPAGHIIYHSPEAGEKVEAGNTIYVTVSKGQKPAAVLMVDVTEKTTAVAKAIISTLKVEDLKITVKEEHSEVSAGCIFKTEPAAGTELTKGQEVILYVSLGTEIKISKMPDVVGDLQADAENTLNNQGQKLTIQIEELFDSEVKPGYVIKTEPAAGEDLATGQTVILYISKGQELAVVPDVTNKEVTAAVTELREFGFKNYTISYITSDVDPGIVLSQSHQQDTPINVDTEIALVVSRGPDVFSPQETTKQVTIALPGDYPQPYTLTIKKDNTDVFTKENIEPGQTQIEVELTGSGLEYYDCYINGERYGTPVRVDFREE